MIERVRRTSGVYRGASPLPTPVAAATAAALGIVEAEPERRERVLTDAEYLSTRLRGLGLAIVNSAAVISFSVGDAADNKRIAACLLKDGIAIGWIGEYAGVGHEGVLRLAVFSTHTEAMIDRLVEALGGLV